MDFILFDLDGTIIDSDQGVVNSVIYAAEHFGIEIKDRTALRVFLGPSPWCYVYGVFWL